MKGRSLILVLLMIAMTVSVAFVGTLFQTGSRAPGSDQAGFRTFNVENLRLHGVDQQVVPVNALRGTPWPIYLVREGTNDFVAFLGQSPHLGCRVGWVGDPHYTRFTNVSQVAFEDPCGGALFTLRGECLGGPCSRGLGTFRVAVTGETATVDLNTLLPGAPRPL